MSQHPFHLTPPPRRTGTTINQIFKASYSGVPVYEFICRGVAVMRRRSDSYVNATQILKVANFDKSQRTRILEREIQKGEHEKVQGGYGKYQGTWVPFARGVQLAQQCNLAEELRPVFEYTPTAQSPPLAPKHITAASNRPKNAKDLCDSRLRPKVQRKLQVKRILPKEEQFNSHVAAEAPYSFAHRSSSAGSPAAAGGDSDHSFLSNSDMSSVGSEVGVDGFPDSDISDSESEISEPSGKRRKSDSLGGGRKAEYGHYADAFLKYFLSDSHETPKILMNLPCNFDVNLVIDDEGHSPLHWAAAMSRMKVLQILIPEGANVGCINYAGQTPLIRSVMFSINYDNRTFAELLELLHPTFFVQDQNGQTVLHHIVLSESKGRSQAARFYMECMVDRILRNREELGPLVNIVDMNGETALTIAARIAHRRLVKLLLKVGGNPKIKNKFGISADDYAVQAYEKARGVSVVTAERGDIREGGNPILLETKTNSGDGRPISLQTAAAAGTRASSKVLPILHKYVDMVGSKFDKETVEADMEIVELNCLLESIKREAEEARRTVEALRVETDRLPKINDRIQALQGELRQTINRNQRLKLRALVHQFSSEFDPDPSFSENTTAATRREEFRNEARALHENLLVLQSNRKQLVEEIVALRSQPGNRHAEYRKLISTCCKLPVENVDGILDPLLGSLDAESVHQRNIGTHR